MTVDRVFLPEDTDDGLTTEDVVSVVLDDCGILMMGVLPCDMDIVEFK